MEELLVKLKNLLNDSDGINQLRRFLNTVSTDNLKQTNQNRSEKESSGSPDFSKILDALSKNAERAEEPLKDGATEGEPEMDIDFEKIFAMTELLGKAKKNDKSTELMLALKPMLKEENQKKIDRVVKIFQLMAIYPVLKESGLLGGDLLGIL